ncbi:creatininase family protein [Ornithinibacillus sp. 4-3]|uniref:Creatininase family protein n=1 Tax=Ornithinibacillus sp. 4-3 TaxID=3231488 RepID=A0AB39HLV6_9BACI
MDVRLSKMTTFEAKNALEEVKVGIIPIGSTEQHGRNMTLETDLRLAEEVAKLISEKMRPDLIVLPSIPVGISYHHMNFPGSMTISPATLQLVIVDYIKSMQRHGLNSFILLNGHGGNQPTLSSVVNVIRYEFKVKISSLLYLNLISNETRNQVTSERYGHACEMETSIGLFLDPTTVRESELEAGELKEYPIQFTEHERGNRRVEMPYFWEELSSNGAFGDATKASREFGYQMIEEVLNNLEIFIKDFINYKV